MSSMNTLSNAVQDVLRNRKTQNDTRDTIVVTCCVCNQTTSKYSLHLLGDFSEANLYAKTKEAAEAENWKLHNGKEFVCPRCVAAEGKQIWQPFSGEDAGCVKCGSVPVSSQYERLGGEHLRRRCGVCTYEWNEACLTQEAEMNFLPPVLSGIMWTVVFVGLFLLAGLVGHNWDRIMSSVM